VDVLAIGGFIVLALEENEERKLLGGGPFKNLGRRTLPGGNIFGLDD